MDLLEGLQEVFEELPGDLTPSIDARVWDEIRGGELEVRIKIPKRFVPIASAERLVAGAKNLDFGVFRGHRLLQETSRLESLSLVVVVADPGDLAAAKLGESRVVAGQLDAAALAPGDDLEKRDRGVVSDGPDLQILDPPALPALVPARQPGAKGVRPG